MEGNNFCLKIQAGQVFSLNLAVDLLFPYLIRFSFWILVSVGSVSALA